MDNLEFDENEIDEKLSSFLDKKQIEDLHKLFQSSKGKSLNRDKLRKTLDKLGFSCLDNNKFEKLFLKIDIDRDDSIGWHEFISYLLLEFRDSDPSNQKEKLSFPISSYPKSFASRHRSNIIRIQFTPSILADGTVNNLDGEYCTFASDGNINFWSIDWDLRRTFRTFHTIASKILILDASYFTDLQIICLSTIRCDLRFFDISGHKYLLRMLIQDFPSPVVKMNNCQSGVLGTKLICGDLQGNVSILEFLPTFKRVFRSGIEVREYLYQDIVKREVETMRCTEFLELHDNTVSKVEFIESLNCFVSAAEQSNTRNRNAPSMIIGDLRIHDVDLSSKLTKFYVKGGITDFCYDAKSQLLASGGPDCLLRLWHPLIPQKPKFIFTGHSTKIIHIMMQDDAEKIYSIDEGKIIKVWDYQDQVLLQTYINLKSAMPENTPMSFSYSDLTRELLVATKRITLIKCCPRLNLEFTDGETHVKCVSAVLHNELFDVIVTCGYDSYIIVWDFYSGKRSILIKNAHTVDMHGDTISVEITAACFDPKHQLLLTGARDGSLKIWNFNEGFCVRKLCIEENLEVTAVFWIPKRILAVGWDKHVTEFEDDRDFEMETEKVQWKICHTDEILCASVCYPKAMITSSTNGDLVFWNLQTGHPYMKFNVEQPKERLKITFYQQNQIESILNKRRKARSTMVSATRSFISWGSVTEQKQKQGKFHADRLVRLGKIEMPIFLTRIKQISVQSIVNLESRPCLKNVATLVMSLNDGHVQMWSHYEHTERCLDQFNAVHMPGDTVTALATDVKNMYLFTGTTHGYIKTWFIQEYCFPGSSNSDRTIEKLKQTSIFPFLWKDEIEGRAKRSFRKSGPLKLFNSYKAHRKPISAIQYIDSSQLLISSSSDNSVRLWTLAGRYIGTLGSPVKWTHLTPNELPPPNFSYRLPPDLKREVSYTTIKVLEGGNVENLMTRKFAERRQRDKEPKKSITETFERSVSEESESRVEDAETDMMTLCNQIIDKSSIAKYLPKRVHKCFEKPVLDTTLPYIPVYSHLKIHPTVKIDFPSTLPTETLNMDDVNLISMEPEGAINL